VHGTLLITMAVGAHLGLGTLRACEADKSDPIERGDDQARARAEMVATQIAARGVADPAVLAAMRKVPRHEFVPAGLAAMAYEDRPIQIGWGQTISQPYIVALMSELANVHAGARVLEVGTGSGYQAAVLAELGADVYTVEIVEPLAKLAAARLARLGYTSVHSRSGDGYRGWPEAAPFDAIVVAAAAPAVPEPLKQQMKIGGRLVLPVGTRDQALRVIVRMAYDWSERTVIPVAFVPMTGEVQKAK
jgi:protein-L-isoaspartate(D-aspartate) O-methyltransferase